MTLKEKIKETLGKEYKPSDEITIDRLVFYIDLYKKACKDLKEEGYRKRVTSSKNVVEGAKPEGNERFYINLSFGVINECSKHIRADIEMLGLSKKGKKIEITNKLGKELSLLSQINSIPDED